MKVYNHTNGRARTEQDLILALDDFLVNDIGWTQVEKVSDTTSNRDYAWSSPGEDDWVAEGGDPVYIRVRGQSDYLYCYGYRTYTNSTINTFELYDATYTRVDLSSDWQEYWFYGDKNFVCAIIIDTYINEPLVMYLGLINSYYGIEVDDYPLAIKGNYSNIYTWNYNPYIYMYGIVASGENTYVGLDWWNTVQYDTGIRNGNKVVMLPVPVVRQDSSLGEVRGEAYGVYHVNGARLPVMGAITSSSGVFITAKVDNNEQRCHAYGPVASGTDSFNMWSMQHTWKDGVEY